MKKRLLAGLMAMCLVLTLLPASALAVDGSTEQTDSSVAKVGELYYDSLADAVAAIDTDTEGIVELVADTTVDRVVEIGSGKAVTLDLGSYKLTPSEKCSSGKVLRNYGTLTITADEGGTIDVSAKSPEWVAIENNKSGDNNGGELNILSGTIIGNSCAINMMNGTANISGGDLSNTTKSSTSSNPYSVVKVTSNAEVNISGNAKLTGVEAAVTVYGGRLTIADNAYLNGTSGGVLLCNSGQSNDASAQHASLEMTGGTVVSDQGFSLAGNNLQSAGCSAEITGGSLQQTSGETCIYWPMEGTLTIGGDAVVEGGSGIEVRMGTVTIQDGATIRGTGAYLDDTPVSGQSQADGSAILVSTEMYGNSESQYADSPAITINITGGTLESSQGNAVTVYNLEAVEQAQSATVEVTGGELQAASGKAAVQVNMMEDCQTELTTTGTGENAIQTSGSSTTVTVSEDASQALVGQGSASSYYTDVNDALENVSASSENPATVYLLDNAEVTVTEGMTLVTPDAVSLTVRPEEGKVIEKVENQEDGTISYKVVEASDSTLQPPTVSLTADKTSAYVGDSITLTASAVSAEGATITYSWYKDGQKISGATASTLTVTSSGIYTVVVTAQKTVNNNVYSAEDDANISCTFVVRDDDDDNDNNNSGSSSSGSTSVRRYNIEADAGRGGDISPDGRVRVRRGENQTFRITADDGWEIADVEVDGESVGAVERYTFENVRTDHTISVTFRQIVTEPEEPETPALPFTDVAEGDWYYDAVAYCWENGIMDGTSGTAFAPNMILTRAMMAQVLYNLADGTASTAAGFPDVAASAWYADAVNWAAANGYVTGYDNGSYGPEDNLTREQLAVILYRYAGSPAPAGSLDGFADAASASAYAVDALRWAVGEGLLTGKDGGRLDPTGTASRAELAQILARFAG